MHGELQRTILAYFRKARSQVGLRYHADMLSHRLIFGPLMIAALILLFMLDARIDRVSIEGTVWQTLLFDRTYLPAGLVMLGVFLVLILLAGRELTRLFRVKHLDVSPFMIGLSGVIGCLLIYAIPHQLDAQITMSIYSTALVIVFMASLLRHCWHGRTQGAIAAGSVTMFAMIYLGILPGFYLAIRRWQSPWIIVAVLLIVKSCDIGAYFTGRYLGRTKLISWLSPKKTIEGLIGGIVTSGLVAVGLAALGNQLGEIGMWTTLGEKRIFVTYPMPLWYAFVGGVLLGLIGQAGDLTASLFKRDAGIKDSGASVPGFGGIIDVLDSPIVAAPVAFWLLQIAWLCFR